MQTWLHFVGRQYYTRASFIREAKRYGVSRRVSLQELKRMKWGDMVLLAIMEGKSAVVFGQFTIERLTGLSPEASVMIKNQFGAEEIEGGGLVIKRGCGNYVTGPTYVTKASLTEIVAFLEQLKEQGVDIGKPMVAGSFILHSPVRLASIPHRQGFRLFDYTRFVAAVQEAQNNGKGKIPVVRGQFYVTESIPSEPLGEGKIQAVKDYLVKR